MATKGKKRGDAIPVVEIVISEGSGTYKFADGSQYSGQWISKDGVKFRHGLGTYTSQYETYEGQWDNDNMHGTGKYMYSTGASYEGSFSNNLYEGEGIYTWPDGTRYQGEWKNSKMHGNGEYIANDGKILQGRFLNGFYDTGSSIIDVRNQYVVPPYNM